MKTSPKWVGCVRIQEVGKERCLASTLIHFIFVFVFDFISFWLNFARIAKVIIWYFRIASPFCGFISLLQLFLHRTFQLFPLPLRFVLFCFKNWFMLIFSAFAASLSISWAFVSVCVCVFCCRSVFALNVANGIFNDT